MQRSLTVGYRELDQGPSLSCIVIHIEIHPTLYPTTLIQQEKRRQIDIVRMCRRQYLRAFWRAPTYDSGVPRTKRICRGQYDSGFPTTLVGFFSRYPGLRHFLGIKLALFSTAVDEHDMQVALSPMQTTIDSF